MSFVVTVLGWAGAASLLVAYGLTSTGKLPPEGARFQSLNLAGAFALTVNSGYHGAWPSAALNLVWIIIGLTALVRARRRGGQPALDQGLARSGSRDHGRAGPG